MNRGNIAVFHILIFLFSTQAFSDSLSAFEIMKKNEAARNFDDLFSRAIISTGEKTKEFSYWKKLSENKKDYKTFTRFHNPPTVRGEGVLFLEHEGKDNEVLLYLPNFKKIRRVENQQQNGRFMGSVFSYADISTPHLEDFKYELLKTEPCSNKDTTLCYVISSKPAQASVQDRYGYSKMIEWVRSDNFMIHQIDYYDLQGEQVKHFEASETKPIGSKWFSHRLKVENVKTKESTLLIFKNVKVDQGIHEQIFTQQNLSRVER